MTGQWALPSSESDIAGRVATTASTAGNSLAGINHAIMEINHGVRLLE
jgi:hypothetical protein